MKTKTYLEEELASSDASSSNAPWLEITKGVDESDVVQFLQPQAQPSKDGGPARAVPYMYSLRYDWGNLKGSWKLNLNWGVIRPTSKVFVSIGEGAAGGPDAGKFIGSAKYTLYNVAPKNGAAEIWIHIDWSYPIRLYVDYLVVG